MEQVAHIISRTLAEPYWWFLISVLPRRAHSVLFAPHTRSLIENWVLYPSARLVLFASYRALCSLHRMLLAYGRRPLRRNAHAFHAFLVLPNWAHCILFPHHRLHSSGAQIWFFVLHFRWTIWIEEVILQCLIRGNCIPWSQLAPPLLIVALCV